MKETVVFDFYSGMKEIKFRRPRIMNYFIPAHRKFCRFFSPQIS